MAHHQSAKKRIRRNTARTVVNRARLSRVRTFIKQVETAIASGDGASARASFLLAQPELHRSAGAGIMHAKTVARRLSRLNRNIKAMA